MKVWAAFSGQDIIGIFTTPERAAAFAAEYNGTLLDDADYVGFDVWQSPPKHQVYWTASASLLVGVSSPVVTLQPHDVWMHEAIELPSDTAASAFHAYEMLGNVYPSRAHRTIVQVYGWGPEGLRERALTWLRQVVNLC